MGRIYCKNDYKYLKMFKLSSAILTLWFVGAAHLDRRWKSAAKWPCVASARVRQTNGVSDNGVCFDICVLKTVYISIYT